MIREITIIGGGFGGARIAKRLARTMRDAHITVIDRDAYHTFYPDIYEVATAHLSEFYERMPSTFYELRSTVAYPIADIFLNDVNVTFLHDEAATVDFDQRQVHLKSGNTHAYDILVMGVGSETNYFGITGLDRYAFPLKTVWDALLMRDALDEVFYRSSKSHPISLVIGGGGFTGCELAGELALFIGDLCEAHGHPPELVSLTVIEAGPTLLGPLDPWTQNKALKRLSKLGVKIMCNAMITSVQENSLTLKDGSVIPFDMMMWTAGVKASGLTHALKGVNVQKNACLTVDKFLRAMPYENVFAAGDVSYCVDEKTGRPLPMTASVAEHEADYIIDAIGRLESQKPLVPYQAYKAGFVVPLGGKYAILDFRGIRISGVVPWMVKHAIALYYWTNLIGIRRAWKLWWSGIHIFVRNDHPKSMVHQDS